MRVITFIPNPKCPVHGIEMRLEAPRATPSECTLYCSMCPRHYKVCPATIEAGKYREFESGAHTEHCYGFVDHVGEHTTLDGTPFSKLRTMSDRVRV